MLHDGSTEIDVNLSSGQIDIDIESTTSQINIDVSSIAASEHEFYREAYEVTPSAEAQVLSTKFKLMTDDLTIGAIPSNYGLITWNGAVLTVS